MAETIQNSEGRILFTREMRKDYKILIPMMAPIHFGLLQKVFQNEGYNMELLQNDGPQVVQEGLKYVHNDTCYPALLVIGQMIDALNSGKYDLDKNRAHHHPDRGRLPCVKLYSPSAQGAEKGGLRKDTGHFPESFGYGKKSGL